MPIGNMYFYSDTENPEGSESVSHTSEGHTSLQGDGNSQLNALNIAIMEDPHLKRIGRLDAAKRVYKSMHLGGFQKTNLKLFRGSHGMKSTSRAFTERGMNRKYNTLRHTFHHVFKALLRTGIIERT